MVGMSATFHDVVGIEISEDRWRNRPGEASYHVRKVVIEQKDGTTHEITLFNLTDAIDDHAA